MDFKEVRHRYYKLGKDRIKLLIKMGYYIPDITPDHTREKLYLIGVEEDGRVNELVKLIEEMEKTL